VSTITITPLSNSFDVKQQKTATKNIYILFKTMHSSQQAAYLVIGEGVHFSHMWKTLA
jgi:hypothetical protein